MSAKTTATAVPMATREVSAAKRSAFKDDLKVGDCFGVYCGGEGEVNRRFFWMAEACAAGASTNAVVYKAPFEDRNWDVKAGDDVLNVRWLERRDEDKHPRKFEVGLEQTISLASTLPQKVTWESQTSTGNFKYLSKADERMFVQMSGSVNEVAPNWKANGKALELTLQAAAAAAAARGPAKARARQ